MPSGLFAPRGAVCPDAHSSADGWVGTAAVRWDDLLRWRALCFRDCCSDDCCLRDRRRDDHNSHDCCSRDYWRNFPNCCSGTRYTTVLRRVIAGHVLGRAVRVRRSGYWVVLVGAGRASGDDALATEYAGLRGGGDRRLAMIYRRQHGMVSARRLLVLHLHRARRNVLFVLGRLFFRCGPRVNAAGPAVVTHAIHGRVVDDRCTVDIGVMDDRCVHVGDGSVVSENATTPRAAHKSYAAVSEAVVNPSIKSYVRTPIPCVPDVYAPPPHPQ